MTADDKKVTSQVQALRQILQKDLARGRRMLAIARALTDALLANDPVRVGEIEAEARPLVEQQGVSDRLRADAVGALAQTLGIQVEPHLPLPTLLEIARRLPLAEGHSLITLRHAILANGQQLQAVQARNQILLQNALDFVQFSLHMLTRLVFRRSRYGTNPNTVVNPTFYINQKA